MAKAGSKGGVYVLTGATTYSGGTTIPAGMSRASEIKEWNMDIGQDTEETTNFDGDGWKEYLATLREWSGNINGNWDVENNSAGLNGQKLMYDAFMAGDSLKVVLFTEMEKVVDEFVPKSGTVFFQGEVILTSMPSNAGVGAVIEFNADFQGNRAPVRSIVSA